MAATQNYSLPLPQLGEPADIRVLDQGTEMIDGIMHGNRTMIAPGWVSTETYNTGSRVVYLGEYYKCKEDSVTGAWDATKWDKLTVGEDIERLGTGGASALADLDDVEITSPTDGQALLYDDSDDKWKNQDLPDVSVTKEASGNPIEITDAAAAPIVKCVTEIQGYQDLHGYDKPWVGGAGKNKLEPPLFNENGISVSEDSNNGEIYINGTASGAINKSFPSKLFSAGTYTFSVTSVLPYGVWISLNNENDKMLSTNVTKKTFTLTESKNLYLLIYINNGVAFNNLKINIQLETGNQQTTFNPYSNICPITAYTEGEIEVSDGDGNTTTHTTTYPDAIYRGSEDCVEGTVTTDWGMIASYAGETLPGEWISDRDEYIPGTTPTTGAQVAYALVTPASASVTPTNLPIKSLSGYNHIESSTGDMEVEYISGNYQPIVDLIQSSSHVYSTAEQVVGKWIDGKDIYEKTFILETEITLSANQWNSITGVSLSGVETPIDAEIRGSRGTSVANVDFMDNPVSVWGTSGTEKVKSITFRYTKATSNRSLSAPVNSQKAQIEPLDEKEEEVPTEEEKTVEMPETEEPENER